ncbi:hypothetical protein, partial [Enterobacter asburiae]
MLIRKLEKKKPRGKQKQKTEEKQDDGKSEMQTEPQTEQAAAMVTPSSDASAGTPAVQCSVLASESATSTAGQRESVAFNYDGS